MNQAGEENSSAKSAVTSQRPRFSNSRSRVLMILPFLIALLSLGIGYAMMLRYELAIETGLGEDDLQWAQFRRSNGLLLLALGGASFAAGALVTYAVRRSLREIQQGLQRAATGRFDMPLRGGSDVEIDQLQDELRHMLDAFNDMSRDSGLGATITVNTGGRVTMINPMTQLLLRVAPDQVVGKPFERLFAPTGGDENAEIVDLLQKSLRRSEPVQQLAIPFVFADGRKQTVRLRTSIFTSDGEQQMAIIIVGHDLAQVSDIRDRIERAARFLTLGSLSAHLAHEIRNPLTSVAGLVELLKESQPDEELKLEYINHIQASADRLNHLIEGLMDFAAVEKCDLVPQAIEPTVREVVRQQRHDPRWAQIELNVDVINETPEVSCDGMWLSRALINLLDNARDATPAGGRVTVTLNADVIDQSVGLTVHNTGSFIAEDQRQLIFDPFHTGKPTGTGLGLAIVQQIVRAHGGTIDVDSSISDGTTFSIRLPAEARQHIAAGVK